MTLSRRQLLLGTAGLAAAGCTNENAGRVGQSPPETTATSTVASTADVQEASFFVEAPVYDGPPPFALGVASGDPDANSVVLWTRLVSSHEDEELLSSTDLAVAIDVALDSDFEEVHSSFLNEAPSAYGHSVHGVAESLAPNTWYFYRFRIGSHTSPTGRTRTMPASGTGEVPELRFGFSSCQHWEDGAYGAHRRLANQDLDLFVWLGDYIYESGPGTGAEPGRRQHDSPEVTTLQGYRRRYGLYKSDLDLQAHHAARPWVVTWDDHEVDNNHARAVSQDGADEGAFNLRRAAAYQAWWEHMPVRLSPPEGSNEFVIYRTIEWGDLAHLHMLDGRQFRAVQPNDGAPVILPGVGDLGVRQLSDLARDPANSMLGSTQREWLEQQVQGSDATWNVLGNQVYMHGLNAFPGEVAAINTDTWDGYFGERRVLLEAIGGPDANLVVLSGDFHSSTAADVRSDPFDVTGSIMATEFMAPAISSAFPEQLRSLAPLVLGLNPQVQHFSPDNGFMTCEVTSERWTTRLYLIDDVTRADSEAALSATFTTTSGQAGIGSIQ